MGEQGGGRMGDGSVARPICPRQETMRHREEQDAEAVRVLVARGHAAVERIAKRWSLFLDARGRCCTTAPPPPNNFIARPRPGGPWAMPGKQGGSKYKPTSCQNAPRTVAHHQLGR